MTTLHRTVSRTRLALAVVAVAWLLAVAGVAAGGRHVVLLPTTGVVDDVMAGYLQGGIASGAADGASAVIIKLDTPGGSLDATQRIVGAILDAPIPVIVWVAPAGGRAASAGTFITLAANVAFMAPGTSIGAASPVGSGGEDIGGTLGAKVKNDAIAKITSIAETRGRNVEWAVQAVRDARSSSAAEAVGLKVVDGLASTLEEVLAKAAGRTVTVAGAPVTLDLAGADVREAGMNPFVGLLHLLSDPDIAFILLLLGAYGLLFEFHTANFVTGVLGGIALILAFTGFGSLPLNIAGLALIGVALLLFVLEAAITSHGLLAIGGAICFALGTSALYTGPVDPFEPVARVAPALLLVTTATTVAFMVLIVVAAARSRRAYPGGPGIVGSPLAAGSTGIVRRPLAPVGSVHVGGEEWTARSSDGRPVERGAAVRVVGTEGLTLIVTPVDPAS